EPAIELPEQIDLGEQEQGSIAIARFSVRNGGRSVLHLDHIRTTCACSGPEREEEGKFVRVSSLQLAPGEQVGLVVRLAVNGRSRQPYSTRVLFDTNDPDRGRAEVVLRVAKVTGGVRAEPTSLAFGTIPVGQSSQRVIDIRDDTLDVSRG